MRVNSPDLSNLNLEYKSMDYSW